MAHVAFKTSLRKHRGDGGGVVGLLVPRPEFWNPVEHSGRTTDELAASPLLELAS